MKNRLAKYISINIQGHFIIWSLMLIIILASCSVFKKEPVDAVPEDEIWNSEGLATLYLNDLYTLTMPSFSGTTNSNMSDEAPGGGNYMYGQLAKDDVGDFSNDTYSKIRRINLLLEKIKTGSIQKSAAQKIIGQALFLRAWVYWNLVNLYGGIPMVMNVQDAYSNGGVAENVKLRRNTTRECVTLIAADLDTAFKFLPAKWDAINYGRITRGAALALKGRMLLFWASPQFNPSTKAERWQWAYDVNKMALDTLTKDGFGLHPSFKELFTDCKEQTSEAIMVRVYDAGIAGSFYHGYDNSVRPGYMGKGGGGSNNATWDLVQAFPMYNGYAISSDSAKNTYNQNRFWLNRDPRFAITIAYNTCTWPLSGNTTYKLWTYYTNDGSSIVSVETPTRSATGFYCRKYVNPAIKSEVCNQIGTDWMEIRYAEVILNFAESAAELEKLDEAKANLIAIRKRAGIDAGINGSYGITASTRAEMVEAVIHERQVELAFENKRYWDLRRRNMFESDLGPSTKKLNGTRRCGWKVELNQSLTKTPAYMASIRDGLDFTQPGLPGQFVYNTYFKSGYRDTLDTQYPISYPQPLYNFFAIPQTNIDKNPNLEQTNYWGGTFDPLAE